MMCFFVRCAGIGFVLFLFAPICVWGQQLPDWTQKIRSDHPRLFFNADTWPVVKQRALNAERDWYQRVKRRTDQLLAELKEARDLESRDLGAEAAAAAFVFLMTDDSQYFELAKKCLRASLGYYELCFERRKTVNWYSTSRVHATLAWDWLYDHLTEAERQEIMSRLS